jgi:hypothetical protein
VSSFFGWGIYGMNLALALVDHPRFTPLVAMSFGLGDVVVDPLRMQRLMRVAEASRGLWASLAALPSRWAALEAPVLHPLDGTFSIDVDVRKWALSGRPDIGVIFFHDTRITAQARKDAGRFPLIVGGSSWAEAILRANGIVATTTVIQGVDLKPVPPCSAGRMVSRTVCHLLRGQA